jgi:hypothetical protein
VFRELPVLASAKYEKFSFTNKRIPRTQLNLFNPGSIIGKSLVIFGDDPDGELSYTMCGDIYTA